jgi:hypothetical protein
MGDETSAGAKSKIHDLRQDRQEAHSDNRSLQAAPDEPERRLDANVSRRNARAGDSEKYPRVPEGFIVWIMLSDAFFSIVHKDCARDELLVRARRRGDIEKVWPEAKVTEIDTADYLFRAVIKRADITAALSGEVQRITYGNFKNSVEDGPLHDAYMRVWTAMASVQESPPYGDKHLFTASRHIFKAAKKKRTRRSRK